MFISLMYSERLHACLGFGFSLKLYTGRLELRLFDGLGPDVAFLSDPVGLIGKRELVALLSLSSWCFLIVVWLFLALPWACLQVVIVVFPDHTHYL